LSTTPGSTHRSFLLLVDISAPVELTARARRQLLSFCSKISPAKHAFHRLIDELHMLPARDTRLERSLLYPSIRFTPVQGH
jgi:hypothetical protein